MHHKGIIMKAFRVTTPNTGTQYTKTIKGVIAILDNDGYDWACEVCFHQTSSPVGVATGYFTDTIMRVLKTSELFKAGVIHMGNESMTFSGVCENPSITIEPITID